MIDKVSIVQSSVRRYGPGLFNDIQVHTSKSLDSDAVGIIMSCFCKYQEVEAMPIEEIRNIVSFVIDRMDVQ